MSATRPSRRNPKSSPGFDQCKGSPSAPCPIGPGSTRPSKRSGVRRTRHELGARGASALPHSIFLLAALACRELPRRAPAESTPDASPPPWQSSPKAPTPPRGMAWVPEGALVAGTPEGRVPRIADQEMAGQQLVLHGFFIDLFAYPNEEGAIPRTGVTQAEAEA